MKVLISVLVASLPIAGWGARKKACTDAAQITHTRLRGSNALAANVSENILGVCELID